MIEIKINTLALQRTLERTAEACRNRQPLMRSIAGKLDSIVQENFAQQGRPRWAGLKVPRPGGKILQNSGRLSSSFEQRANNDTATVSTNVEYAAIHQFGGKTRPHTIRPRNKQALKFGGRYAKRVHHPGSAIPARPFLQLTDSDVAEIVADVEDYTLRAGA